MSEIDDDLRCEAEELVADIEGRGYRVEVVGGRLRASPEMRAEDLHALGRCAPAVVALLRANGVDQADSPIARALAECYAKSAGRMPAGWRVLSRKARASERAQLERVLSAELELEQRWRALCAGHVQPSYLLPVITQQLAPALEALADWHDGRSRRGR